MERKVFDGNSYTTETVLSMPEGNAFEDGATTGYPGLVDIAAMENIWFRNRHGRHPYSLLRRSSPNEHSFYAVSFFPWTVESLGGLWNGDVEMSDDWRNMVSEFSGAIAVGGKAKLYVFWLLTGKVPFVFSLTPVSSLESSTVWIPSSSREDSEKDSGEIRSIAWTMDPSAPTEPLIVFSGSSVITILNVRERRVVGRLRGHGGQITSIVTHPTHPQVICTTSRDFSSRVYDLNLKPIQKPNNTHWPPNKLPSLAGAAHGLHMSEPEGFGIGRCIIVLMGGRSGGHRGAVLGAAFHPVLPLIATCGMDREVKIWRIPAYEQAGDRIAREDKPLFSSSRVHAARILSVNWLSHDVLVTHSAPAIMRHEPENTESTLYFVPGTVALWRWLALDRFFPPNQPMQKVLRGCASDYQESSSYKLLSIYSLPIIETEHDYFPLSPSLHVFQHPSYDPLLLFSVTRPGKIMMINVTHFAPRKPPPFPYDEDVVEMTKRLRLDDEADEGLNNNAGDLNDDGGSHINLNGAHRPKSCKHPDYPPISGWDIDERNDGPVMPGHEESQNNAIGLEACAMGMGGRLLVGVGSRGTIWIWVDKEP